MEENSHNLEYWNKLTIILKKCFEEKSIEVIFFITMILNNIGKRLSESEQNQFVKPFFQENKNLLKKSFKKIGFDSQDDKIRIELSNYLKDLRTEWDIQFESGEDINL